MSIKNREENVKLSRTFRNIRDLYGLSNKSVCDIGCGFGEYLRLFGKGSVGVTTTTEEVDYGKKNNLKIVFGNAEKISSVFVNGEKFQAIWANNLFEHLLSPHGFLMNLKKISDEQTIAIIGVPVLPKIVSLIHLAKFHGSLASNHVSFFTKDTLRLTVERGGLDVIAVRPFIFKNKYLDLLVRPFAPHLYVVAKNNSDFAYSTKKLKEWVSDDHYSSLLDITKQNE
jgi:SAM-dependent methyltransferase